MGGNLSRLQVRSREVSQSLIGRVEASDESELARRLDFPWLAIDVSVGEALLHVIVHSIEHRADLATVLTRNGFAAPGLDLVHWIADGRP